MSNLRLFIAVFGLGIGTGVTLACQDPGGEECAPGQLGCECLNAVVCVSGSVCELGICVPAGAGESGDGDGDSGDGDPGDGDPGDGDGDGACQSSADCLDTEVCLEGACGDTDLYYFDARVVVFEPPICRDGIGNAELVFDVFQDDVFTDMSSEVGCPGAWPNEPFVYDSLKSLVLDFYEVDLVINDPIVSMCWQDEFMLCLPVPKQVLHDGEWMGWVGDSYIEMNFDPRPF